MTSCLTLNFSSLYERRKSNRNEEREMQIGDDLVNVEAIKENSISALGGHLITMIIPPRKEKK